MHLHGEALGWLLIGVGSLLMGGAGLIGVLWATHYG